MCGGSTPRGAAMLLRNEDRISPLLYAWEWLWLYELLVRWLRKEKEGDD